MTVKYIISQITCTVVGDEADTVSWKLRNGTDVPTSRSNEINSATQVQDQFTFHTTAAVKISLPHSKSNELACQFDGVLKFCHPTRPSKSCAKSLLLEWGREILTAAVV